MVHLCGLVYIPTLFFWVYNKYIIHWQIYMKTRSVLCVLCVYGAWVYDHGVYGQASSGMLCRHDWAVSIRAISILLANTIFSLGFQYFWMGFSLAGRYVSILLIHQGDFWIRPPESVEADSASTARAEPAESASTDSGGLIQKSPWWISRMDTYLKILKTLGEDSVCVLKFSKIPLLRYGKR